MENPFQDFKEARERRGREEELKKLREQTQKKELIRRAEELYDQYSQIVCPILESLREALYPASSVGGISQDCYWYIGRSYIGTWDRETVHEEIRVSLEHAEDFSSATGFRIKGITCALSAEALVSTLRESLRG